MIRFLLIFILSISSTGFSQEENLSFLRLIGSTGKEKLEAKLVDLTYDELVSCLNKSPDTISYLTIYNCIDFKWEYDVLKRFTKLYSLEINKCNIQKVPDWISTLNIESIDLKKNDIQEIDLFKLIGKKTRILNLSQNENIQPFCSDTLKKMSTLLLSSCNINDQVITKILNFVPNIKSLELMKNPITDLKMKRDFKLNKLNYLNLEYTPFKNFNDRILNYFPNLKILWITSKKVQIGIKKQNRNFRDLTLRSEKIVLGSGIKGVKTLNVFTKKFKISAKKISVEKLNISAVNKVNLKKIADSLIFYQQYTYEVTQNLSSLKNVKIFHFECYRTPNKYYKNLYKTLHTLPKIKIEEDENKYVQFFHVPQENRAQLKEIVKEKIDEERIFFMW